MNRFKCTVERSLAKKITTREQNKNKQINEGVYKYEEDHSRPLEKKINKDGG